MKLLRLIPGFAALTVSCASPTCTTPASVEVVDFTADVDFYIWHVPGTPCNIDTVPKACFLHYERLEPATIPVIVEDDVWRMWITPKTDDEQYRDAKRRLFSFCAEPVLYLPARSHVVGLSMEFAGTEECLIMLTCARCTKVRSRWLTSRWIRQHILRNNHYSLYDSPPHVVGVREQVFRNGEHVRSIVRNNAGEVYWVTEWSDGDLIKSWEDFNLLGRDSRSAR